MSGGPGELIQKAYSSVLEVHVSCFREFKNFGFPFLFLYLYPRGEMPLPFQFFNLLTRDETHDMNREERWFLFVR